MSASMSAGYELSPQQKLFFLQGTQATVAGLALLLEGETDSGKVRSAIQALVERHEILRTSFQRRTGMKFPFQIVSDEVSVTWDEVDFGALGAEEQQSRNSVLLADSSRIDIENGPVLHARLAKLGHHRHALILTISALCVDDASLNQISAEFGSLYAGDTVPNDVLQYADYSEWQSEFLSAQDDDALKAASFWQKTEFDSLPALSVPFERTAPTGARAWKSFPVQMSSPIPDDFLFAAWHTFLARLSGRQEFTLGFVSDGRNREEFATGVGLFTRVLPVRANF